MSNSNIIKLGDIGITGNLPRANMPTAFPDYYFLKRTLTPAEILTSFSAPIDVIPAPGGGFAISILGASAARLVFNSVAYVVLGNVQLIPSTGLNAFFIASGFISSPSSAFGNFSATAASSSAMRLVENDKIQFRSVTGDPTLGNSPIDLYLYYNIIAL